MARRWIPVARRATVAARANHRCEYCQIPDDYTTAPFETEHVYPVSQGGADELEDLAYSCRGCNGAKGILTEAIDPETEEIVSLFHPRRDEWRQHFDWSDDFTNIIGLTPTGRATIVALDMNRLPLINLRRVLKLINLHPPADGH